MVLDLLLVGLVGDVVESMAPDALRSALACDDPGPGRIGILGALVGIGGGMPLD
jgi:hypothetical protein